MAQCTSALITRPQHHNASQSALKFNMFCCCNHCIFIYKNQTESVKAVLWNRRVETYLVKTEHYLRHKNMAYKKQGIIILWDICNYLCIRESKTIKKVRCFPLCQIIIHLSFKINFQKVDQHTGGKWLIHCTKHCKDNVLQRVELPCRKA